MALKRIKCHLNGVKMIVLPKKRKRVGLWELQILACDTFEMHQFAPHDERWMHFLTQIKSGLRFNIQVPPQQIRGCAPAGTLPVAH